MRAPNTSPYFIGLMSGTSMDGVDGVVTQITGNQCKVLAHHSLPMPKPLKDEFLALNTSGTDELHRAALAANQLVDLYGQVVAGLMYSAELEAEQICAIGAHGQTVRHRPEQGYTWQLNNPARLARRTGIAVVADFRSADISAGGQGAPLVPAFHQAVFGQMDAKTAIVNIGGIANITLLNGVQAPSPALAGESWGEGENLATVVGFDTGPGNVFMDAWINWHLGQAYDAYGQWATGGSILQGLLDRALQEPYFSKPAPKSTGRDLFHLAWLETLIGAQAYNSQDVQRTLLELTARTIADAVPTGYQTLSVCGGGALNTTLMQRLQILLPQMTVQSTDALGIPPMQVEAAAFAWLAAKCVRGETLLMQKITGSHAPLIYGAVYPA